MQTSLISLIDILDSNIISKTGVIEWGSPVPSFGNISNSWVATLGLNPSNREFIDDTGNELKGGKRRFQTLSSLRLKSWSEIDSSDLYLITESCNNYFQNNPYDRWFKVLDLIISGIDSSFYSQYSSACHLDLIPFATKQKWNYLSKDQKTSLLEISSHTLGSLICESPIKLLILNGQSVIDNFQLLAQIQLEKEKKTEWSLPRHTSNDVQGFQVFH